jgi:hypothetical protein
MKALSIFLRYESKPHKLIQYGFDPVIRNSWRDRSRSLKNPKSWSEKSSGSYWMNSGRSGSQQSDFPFHLVPSINERLRFLSPIYKLIRYHRLIFDSAADAVFRSTYLPLG